MLAADPSWFETEHEVSLAEPWRIQWVPIVNLDTGEKWVDTSGKDEGPSIYVDGVFVGSLYEELIWYNMGNLKSERLNNDSWWKGTYQATGSNGITYTVRFYDPQEWTPEDVEDGDSYVRVGIAVHIDRVESGSSHTVTLSGKWGTSRDEGDYSDKTISFSYTYSASIFNKLFPDTGLTAKRTSGKTIQIDGTLNASYATTVSTVKSDASKNSGALMSTSYNAGATAFSVTANYNDLSDTNYGNHHFYFQRATSIDTSSDWPEENGKKVNNVQVYRWNTYTVLREFIRPKYVSLSADKWNKKVVVSWTPDVTTNYTKCTEGKWRIYRYLTSSGASSRTQINANDLDYDKNSYEDSDNTLVYDKEYTYEVAFIPTDGGRSERLTKSKSTTISRSFNISDFKVTGNARTITLTWNSEATQKGTTTFSVYRTTTVSKGVPSGWGDAIAQVTANTYTDPEKNVAAGTTYYYKVMATVSALNDYTVETGYAKGSINDLSTVTKFTATKGDYNGLVKLTWEADQVGTTATVYNVQRREKGIDTWSTIYKTSGTSTAYYYEDNTALPGKYYEYQVENGYSSSRIDDGFCRSTGIVSGRVSYGTGTAVADTRVDLKFSDEEGTRRQFYSLHVTSNKGGVRTKDFSAQVIEKFKDKPYSLQFYIKPDATTYDEAVICDVGGTLQLRLKKQTDGSYKLKLLGRSDVTDIKIPTTSFSHVTITMTAAGVPTIYVIDEQGNMNTWTGTLSARNYGTSSGISMGSDYAGAGQYISCYIDEMRVFTKTLTKEEILKNYNHTLSGTEDGLLIYWPVDEGISNPTTAYDYSKTSGVTNSNHGVIDNTNTSLSTDVPAANQLGLFALTDAMGNFVIRGVPFSGDGTNYTVTPSKGIHEFSPAYVTRYVSGSSLVHSGVDFTDVSSFPVSGYVYYKGTSYPVEGCNFYVDGDVCSNDGKLIESDENGHFEISVPIGRHFIEVKKDGHVFVNEGRYPEGVNNTLEYVSEVTNLTFRDSTLVNFSGRVVGGDIEGSKPLGFRESKNNIGQAQLVLTAEGSYSLNTKTQGTTTSQSVVNDNTVPCPPVSDETFKSVAYRGANGNSNRIYIQTDPRTGEFSAMVPPISYTLGSITRLNGDKKTFFSGSEALDMSNLQKEVTDTLVVDSASIKTYTCNYRLCKTYHSAPVFVVKQSGNNDGAFGLKSLTLADGADSLQVSMYDVDGEGNVTYKYGGPVFESENQYTFDIEAYEQYENADDVNNVQHSKVPLQGLTVTVANALSDGQAVYALGYGNDDKAGTVDEVAENQLVLDGNGCATYTWKAGLPNITSPYTRTLQMSYDIDGSSGTWPANNGVINGVILGSLSTGSNFVTSGPDKVEMILRDPPGSNSFSSWTSGSVTSSTRSIGKVWDSENEVATVTNLGPKVETEQGIGFAVINSVEAKDEITAGVNVTVQGMNADQYSTTLTVTREISTSDQPEYDGACGDVFIGTANNIIYGKARQVGFEVKDDGSGQKTAELGLTDIWTTGLQMQTGFNYTAWHIENILLPNLRDMRNRLLKYVPDTTAVNTSTSSVPQYLTQLTADDERFGSDNNDKSIWANATDEPSSSGPSYKMVLPVLEGAPADTEVGYTDSVMWCNNQISNWESIMAFNEREKVEAYEDRATCLEKNYSFDSGTTITKTQTNESGTGSTYENTVVSKLIVGNEAGLAINKVGVFVQTATRTGGGKNWDYEDTETEISEFSYTLSDQDAGDAITVDVYRKGDYGPIFRTRGGQTSAPYEGEVLTQYYKPGTTVMEATMQIEAPKIAASPQIISDIPSGSAANFTLSMTNESETGDDVYYKLLLVDNEYSDNVKVTINGMPLTDNRLVRVPAGETVTKTLQLYQTDLGVLDFNRVGIVLASTTQYDNTSTWDQIADTTYVEAHFVPSSSPVTMALDLTTLNAATGSDLTVRMSDFDRTYKNLKAFRIQYKKQGATDWITAREYVTADKWLTGNNEKLPESGSSVTYTMPMKSYSDGSYTFRVLSVTHNGSDGEVTRSSNEIAVVKDMQKPCPLGQPSPSNGILSVGDDISLTFNESILKGELTQDLNFLVTGVLNGAEVDHATALRMDGTDVSASTEADISLAGKDFSIDSWVRISGSGTLLSHGNGASKFTVAVGGDNRLVVGIGSDTYTSANPLPTDRWSFLSLSYTARTNGGTVNAAVAYDDTSIDLFKNLPVASYEGNGALSVGRKMQGAIHELTLWDEAHDMSTALANRLKTKNPSTAHLIGYWKMNEGEGTDITDYARSRHMYMPDATWYLNNENTAVALDGTSHLAIPTAEVSPLGTDNCAIEFWVRGGSQTGEAQLMQAGEVSLWATADGLLRLTSLGNTYEAGSVTLLDNAWHHIALNILRTGNAAVYVDGLRTFATSASNVGQTASDCLVMGQRRTNTDGVITYDRAFKGEVDEVRIWNATLGADIINERSHQRLTGTEAGLVAYYPFETKALDGYGQLVTQTTASDLCHGRHSATYGTALTFTDQAPALRQKPVETNVPFSYTASDNTIVITVDADAATIEGCTLHFTVTGVSDANGNKSEAVTWSAFVNRNELSWSEASLSATKHVADEATLSATIVNGGAQQQMWTLTGMPSWLKASVAQGTTEALSQTRLTFTVSKSAPIGKHEQTLYLTGNEGLVTPLVLTVTVTGDVPDWSVDPSLYDGTMNLIGSLSILGVPSSDTDDVVAAFVDGECRGVAHPVYNTRYDSYFVMMDIYGNASDDKGALTFRAYDASTGTVYSRLTTGQDFTFVFDQFLGKYSSPVALAATDLMEQNQRLGTGWNWTSLYVVPDSLSASVVYAPVAPVADIVKSKSAFLSSDGTTWHGNAFDVDVRSMYKVHMTADRTLALTGRSATAAERTVTVQPGWNWIGYNCLYTLSVADAFAALDPQDGDIVKGQSGFAMFDGYEWNGSLSALTPGQGYMLYSTAATARTLTYPTRTAASAPSAVRSLATVLQTFAPVDHHLYSGNMCVVALVTFDGQPCAGAEVGVFADGECRTAQVTDAQGYAYFTIPGDNPASLSFCLDRDGKVLTTGSLLTYVTDAVHGTYQAPFAVGFTSASPSAIGFIPADAEGCLWLDLNGRTYSTRPSAPGVYLLRTTDPATGATSTVKVIVK